MFFASDNSGPVHPAILESLGRANAGYAMGYGNDPFSKSVAQKIRDTFEAPEAAVYLVPTGTAANSLILATMTKPWETVFCTPMAHINCDECNAPEFYMGGAKLTLVEARAAKMTPESLRKALDNEGNRGVHGPQRGPVSITTVTERGTIYSLEEIRAISAVTKEYGLKLHLDGARLFNALVETGESPADWGAQFDTISICLSKGLGCPIGSILLGTKADIKRAKKVRKVFGGGMRQAGFLAAAGIYALDHQVERLKEDHHRARVLGQFLVQAPHVAEVLPVATNIVIARLEGISPETYLQELNQKGIKGVKFGKDLVRFVTHLDFGDDHLEEFGKRIGRI